MKPTFYQALAQQHINCKEAPSNQKVIDIFQSTIALLYPFFQENRPANIRCEQSIKHCIQTLSNQLKELIKAFPVLCPIEAKQVNLEEFLPLLSSALNDDINAIFNEDPAAKSKDEIIRCYPGFYAVAAYRFAHWLHQHQIEIIPRMITEYAHSKTGIDIHPGASIGRSFCIDHGTGVVIGETTTIGDNVKLYQGVTLGALSVHKNKANTKRHPTIKNNVVIYANATILGGETVIGEHSIIGGNVWLTKSVAPNSKIYYTSQRNKQL